MNEYLVIFPSVKQISYLNAMALEDRIVYIILQNDDEPQINNPQITFSKKDDKIFIKSLQEKELFVLCCHEEALFWARVHADHNWKHQFSRLYLNLLEKQCFKQFAKEKKIPIGYYSSATDDIKSFPIIAKPSIGFGSIGVRILRDKTMFKNYVESFVSTISSSGIYEYQKRYFSEKTNRCIFETPINGNFFRTPFIVNSKICKYIFPVRGVSKRSKKNTDFNWVEFEYSTKSTFSVQDEINDMHNQLVESFDLADGVYISEFIISKNNKPTMLEFSPRQPSGRIGKMIYLATGIDLEIEAVRYFFKQSTSNMNCVDTLIRLRLQSSTVQFKPLDGFELIEEDYESSVHGENIQCMYLKK